MKSYNLKEEVIKLDPNELKAYYYLYAGYGFELGFGKGGKYPGHSHLYFYDILYSSLPILTNDANGKNISGKLIVTPPKTYMGEVVTDDFFFVKFCPTNDAIILPDKVNHVEKVGLISSFSNQACIELDWFKNHLSEKSFFKLDYKNNILKINFGEKYSFLIS